MSTINKVSEGDNDEHINVDDNNINSNLYKNVLLDEYIYLRPVDLNYKIDDIILAKLKLKVEGRCLKIGYVMPNTIKIQSRSLGMINNASFDGMTTFKITFTCDVCNPIIGQIIKCQVANIDKSQIVCYIDAHESSPVEVYLFKQNHSNNVEYTNLKIGDIISAKVGGSKWEYKDKQIVSIAVLV